MSWKKLSKPGVTDGWDGVNDIVVCTVGCWTYGAVRDEIRAAYVCATEDDLDGACERHFKELGLKLEEPTTDDRRVVAAAVRTPDGLTHSMPRPARHHDVVNRLAAAGIDTMRESVEQGFLLSDGTFADREAARKIVDRNGQGIERDMHLCELFSEDVW